MRKSVAFVLAFLLLLSGCGAQEIATSASAELSDSVSADSSEIPDFSDLSDPNLLQYVEDSLYAEMSESFRSEDYIVEDISATFVSKEYLEELAYNSQSNIYFGYTLAEIEEQFDGERYVFTLGDDGQTAVKAFEAYDDTFEQVVKNVAVGSGVILICATVSVVSGGLGAPAAVSVIFAAAAKTVTAFALSSGTMSAVIAGTVKGIQTKDFDEALKAAALSGSEGFKWGAITGVITGGASKAVEISRLAKTVPTPRESELRALKQYGGTEQVSFLNGEQVPINTSGATRPDVLRTVDGHFEAIEVKNYNLKTNQDLLCSELRRQVTSRVSNLPSGSTQRIVLDVRGRGYTAEFLQTVISRIQNVCAELYPNIPVDILSAAIV